MHESVPGHLADIVIRPDDRFAPEAAGRAFITAQKWLLVIDEPLTKERRGGRDGGGSSHACTRQPQSSTLEQRIARRPEEASRTEACMVDSSSVRNRRIKARSCNL